MKTSWSISSTRLNASSPLGPSSVCTGSEPVRASDGHRQAQVRLVHTTVFDIECGQAIYLAQHLIVVADIQTEQRVSAQCGERLGGASQQHASRPQRGCRFDLAKLRPRRRRGAVCHRHRLECRDCRRRDPATAPRSGRLPGPNWARTRSGHRRRTTHRSRHRAATSVLADPSQGDVALLQSFPDNAPHPPIHSSPRPRDRRQHRRAQVGGSEFRKVKRWL